MFRRRFTFREVVRLLSVALLTACAPNVPPSALGDVPALVEPAPMAAYESAPDECDEAMPYLPGRPVPYAIEGIAVCRAVVLPERSLFRLLEDGRIGDAWESSARLCHSARVADRATCEEQIGLAQDDLRRAQRDAALYRTAGAVGIGAAFVLGLVVGGL